MVFSSSGLIQFTALVATSFPSESIESPSCCSPRLGLRTHSVTFSPPSHLFSVVAARVRVPFASYPSTTALSSSGTPPSGQDLPFSAPVYPAFWYYIYRYISLFHLFFVFILIKAVYGLLLECRAIYGCAYGFPVLDGGVQRQSVIIYSYLINVSLAAIELQVVSGGDFVVGR